MPTLSNTPKPLDIFAVALDAINLIEASAGTGKTYAIAGLYLRLVAELGRKVGDILVVTYTKAATEELKERIRARLVEARAAFQHGQSDDLIYKALLERCTDHDRTLRRLNNALLAFDEAAIFTIHGFCQRVLMDRAFASGMPFETEILGDDAEVLRELVEDFWRSQCHNLRPLLANHIIQQKLIPATLQAEIKQYLNKPYLTVAELPGSGDLTALEQVFIALHQQATALWLQERATIIELLHSKDLKGNIYNKNMPQWFEALDIFLDPNNTAPTCALPDKFANFTARKLKGEGLKKGGTAPVHQFFAVCEMLEEAATQLGEYFQTYLKRLRYDLLAYCNRELPQRKRRLQAQSYDDLLLNLQQAVTGAHGQLLTEAIRKRYTAALIDEFQDTDPTQYTIFHTIYHESGLPVFLVGDPKQAIYSFRGADIFAYLQAKQQAGAEYTLDTNWRSDPALISAVNALFRRHDNAFLLEHINFYPVKAAARAAVQLQADDGSSAPLRVWYLPGQSADKPLPKGEASDAAALVTAGRIARLLNMATQGQATITDKGITRPLTGGDIAVLVRSHHQAGLVRRALLDLGVPSVQHSRDSVFDTPEALELEQVLLAIAEPRREDIVRAALLTDVLGDDGTVLGTLLENDHAWEQILQEFSDYHRLWREQGFIRMFRYLLSRRGVYGRLLAFRDGERRLTNVLHLAELLQAASVNRRLTLDGLVQWLAAERADPTTDEDSRQLRLESDAALVKIVTIHKSKGLEYPLVFCPFLWDGKLGSKNQALISVHEQQPGGAYHAVLDLGTAEQEQRRCVALREELAENLRLAYVALTRAKLRCYVIWGRINQAEDTALAWLLHGGADDLEVHREQFTLLDDTPLWTALQDWAAAAPGAVHCEVLPDPETTPYRPTAQRAQPLAACEFRGRIHYGWRFTSFTALHTRHSSEIASDYDAEPAFATEALDSNALTVFTFPRGTSAGRCLHAIFERLDFSADATQIERTVSDHLLRYGFATTWSAVITAAISRTLHAPLDGPGVTLAQVLPGKRLTEMEFMYRVKQLDASALQRRLAAHGGEWGTLLGSLDFLPLQGFMRGFIDLVFEANGRAYLVDYKSNWLGNHIADYAPQHLATAMTAGGYHLQYLIYTVALHRYLRWRRPDYDYDRHIGGVRYLFLRGIDPEYADYGIFAARPPKALIEDLDAYLNEQERRYV